MKRIKLFIVNLLFLCFLVLIISVASAIQQKPSSSFSSETITAEDFALSRLPVLILIADQESFDAAFSSILPFQEYNLIEQKKQILELINVLSTAPAVFSSRDRFRRVLVEKLQEIIKLPPELSEAIAEQIVSSESLKELSGHFYSAINELKVKDEFAPQRIILVKDDVQKTFEYRNYSGQEITKEEIQEIFSSTKIPKSVIRIEGINPKEMISPVALTDGGKTVLVKKGIQPSDIKPIMFLRPIKRKAIAYAARRQSQRNEKKKKFISLKGKKIPISNLTEQNFNERRLEEQLNLLKIPSTVNQIEVLLSAKMGTIGISLTDEGSTLLVSADMRNKEIVEDNYLISASRKEIVERANKKTYGIKLQPSLLTIPSMIAGLDLREIYETLVNEFLLPHYDIDINYMAEPIAVAVIRSTSNMANFVSQEQFKKGLEQEGIERRIAELLSQEETIETIAKIIYGIRERVLAMAGKKVVVYIDNREIPLLTTGSTANYTPRQISLAQKRLIKERIVLSQVDEIIMVDNLNRTLGYTVRSEGIMKAYLSSVFLIDDVIIPPLNWMPTMGDSAHFSYLSMPNLVVSSYHPQVKVVLVSKKERKKAQEEISDKGEALSYVYEESKEASGKIKDIQNKEVSLELLAEKSDKQNISILVDDSLLSSLDIDLAVWLFGPQLVREAILLENNGRFRSKTDDTEYDFTAVAEEFVESLHRPIIEQNLLLLKEDLIKEKGVFIDGMRVVPSSDYSIGRMDARLRKIPFDNNQKEKFLQERVVLELGEDMAIAIMNGDVSIVQLKKVLKGGKIKLAPEEKRKWDRQRKLYQAKINEKSKFNLFSSDSIDKDASKTEKMFTAGLNKAFHKGTGWIENQIEGEEHLKGYQIVDSLDVTFKSLFEIDQKKENINKIKISALMKIYSDLQAQNALIFKKE